MSACPGCGWDTASCHCGPRGDEPPAIADVARTIAQGGAFTDTDAVRLARAYLSLAGLKVAR